MPEGDAENESGETSDAGEDLHALLRKLERLVDPRRVPGGGGTRGRGVAERHA